MTIGETTAVTKSLAATAARTSRSDWLAALRPFASIESSSRSAASFGPLRAVEARKPFLCWLVAWVAPHYWKLKIWRREAHKALRRRRTLHLDWRSSSTWSANLRLFELSQDVQMGSEGHGCRTLL